MQRLLRNIGFILILLGLSSFLWPILSGGSRRGVMAYFGEHEKTAAIASLAVGGVIFALSFRKKKDPEKN